MSSSIINIQRNTILEAVRYTPGRDWKVLVLDEESRKLIDNAVKEDDILNENVTNIEQIEHKRQDNPDTDAVYILSPLPHIVDCLISDLTKKKYRRAFLIWTAVLEPSLRGRLDKLPKAREQIADFRILNIDYHPRESHVVLFKDPWSFPVLFNPACNKYVGRHLEELAQKIVSVCVSLGEYPTIRYYNPRVASHEASVLCSHLARFVQDELDQYAQYNQEFPPPSNRPRGVLYITDRTMDLYSPLLHEFTYQAMAHDLLPIADGDKVTYQLTTNQGTPAQEVKDMEISEKDKIWVENRHLHMKDLLGKLADDFNKFRAQNPQFAETVDKANVNTIKDMLAGLPEFQEGKEAYSLHLTMAESCMKIFQEHKLLDIAALEQSLATGLDEDYRKPKNLADNLVRLLDDDDINAQERIRLIVMYLIYRDGLLGGDISKLLSHAQLPPQNGELIYNLDLLGVRVQKHLKDSKPPPLPLFPQKPPPANPNEETNISRFEPALKMLLEGHCRGFIDQATFPSTRPQLDDNSMTQDSISQASLRSAKPTWARTRPSRDEPRQRIIVFIAGGATYAEARSCYEISEQNAKDVYLASSHMLTPGLFLRQVGELSMDKRRLDLPYDRPPPKAPAHLFEVEKPPEPLPKPSTAHLKMPGPPGGPPTAAMAAMSMASQPNSMNGNGTPTPPPNVGLPSGPAGGKLSKKTKEDKKEEKKRNKEEEKRLKEEEKKDKKKRGFFK